jgi:hypothetical protein
MSFLQAIGLIVAAYVVLLARSAWRQGEFRQYVKSLAVLSLLLALVASVVAGYIWWDRH